MPRRERATIVGELLEALSREGARGSSARLTHVATHCNIPYDRFRQYLEDLKARGLIEATDPFRLTPGGRRFLGTYREWRESLRLFGMGE